MKPEAENGSLTTAVCVKYSVDVESIRVAAATRAPDFTHATRRVGGFDENAIEAGLRLRDKHGGRVLAVSAMEDKPATHILRQPLAMGADELHLACDTALRDCDAFAIAEILAALIRECGEVDVVICGDASADENRGEVGPRLAEALGIPAITHVTSLDFSSGRRLFVDRTIESRVESLEVMPPVLVTVSSETNESRLPTLRGIMRAGNKPVVERRLADLALPGVGDPTLRTETLATYAPLSTRKRVAIAGEDVAECTRFLLRHLQEDAAIEA